MLRTKRIAVVLVAALALILSACGGIEDQAPERGVRTATGKADLPGSCKGFCGGQSADGCYCDDQCETYGDCCADKTTECADPKKCGDLGGYCLPLTYPMGQCKPGETADSTPGLCGGPLGQSTTCCVPVQPQTCADLTCEPGYHCEMKGINGGAIPVCIKDEGQFCGGIAGLPCPVGFKCVLDGNYPDAGGKCVACPPVLCELYCEDGFDVDANGCEICQCKQPERNVASGMCIKNSFDSCNSDADCVSGGCGGELCFNPAFGGGFSTCECVQPSGVSCGCVNGKCAWWN